MTGCVAAPAVPPTAARARSRAACRPSGRRRMVPPAGPWRRPIRCGSGWTRALPIYTWGGCAMGGCSGWDEGDRWWLSGSVTTYPEEGTHAADAMATIPLDTPQSLHSPSSALPGAASVRHGSPTRQHPRRWPHIPRYQILLKSAHLHHNFLSASLDLTATGNVYLALQTHRTGRNGHGTTFDGRSTCTRHRRPSKNP